MSPFVISPNFPMAALLWIRDGADLRSLLLTPERFRKHLDKLSSRRCGGNWRDDERLMSFLAVTGLLEISRSADAESEVTGWIARVVQVESPTEIKKEVLASRARLR